MSISSVDLNLLLVLHTVLVERNVARAAERLHVTPSAVSNALARLRHVLSDPLVTRKGRGIVPTPRATELAPAIARAIAELEHALHGAPFDPATCTRTFTLAVADAGQVAWVPSIAGAMLREMPKAQLRVVGIDALVSLGDLTSSEIDLHIGMRSKDTNLHVERLFEERMQLVARAKQASLLKRLSASKLGELRHVRVDMVPGRNSQDRLTTAYARAGIPRHVVLTVPTFTAAAAVVASSDLVTSLPESFLAAQSGRFGLRALSGPVPKHTVEIAMSWHERTHSDRPAAAFRSIVRAALSELTRA